MPNSQGYNVTQSAWAMDADADFTTGVIYSSENSASWTAGELQNDYSQCYGSTFEGNHSSSYFSKIAWTGSSGMSALEDNPVQMNADWPNMGAPAAAVGAYLSPWTDTGNPFGKPQYLLWGASISSSWGSGPPLQADVTQHNLGIDFPNKIFNNLPLKTLFSIDPIQPAGFMVSAWVNPHTLTGSTEGNFLGFWGWSCQGEPAPERPYTSAQSTYAPAFNCEDDGPYLNMRNCRWTILSFANQNPIFSGSGGKEVQIDTFGEDVAFKIPGSASINIFLENQQHPAGTETQDNLSFSIPFFRLTAELLVTVTDDSGDTLIVMDSASTDYVVPANEWSHIFFSYGGLQTRAETTLSWPTRFGFYVNGVHHTASSTGSVDLKDYTSGKYFDFDSSSAGWNCPGSGAIGIDASYYANTASEGSHTGWMRSSSANQSAFEGYMDEVALFPYSFQNIFGYPPGSYAFDTAINYVYNNGCPANIAQQYLTLSNYVLGGTQPGCLSPALWYRHGDLVPNLDRTGIGANDPGAGMDERYGTITNRMSVDNASWPSVTGALPANYYFVSGNLFAWPGQQDESYAAFGQNRGWIQFTSSVPCAAGLVTPQRETLIAAPIYNRKHQMASVFSPMQFGWDYPLGSYSSLPYASQSITMIIPEITPAATYMSATWQAYPYTTDELAYLIKYPLGKIDTCGGNALWETGRLAGHTKDGSFIDDPRFPFYNTYGDYARTLKLKNKIFSLIPEFRISEFIDFYETENAGDYLVPNSKEFSIWGVPTGSTRENPANSSQENFYQIFSNSDFLSHFSIIKKDHQSGLNIDPATITLECNALMKFIAYDGFYPSERCLQMANQFSKSYGESVSYQGSDDYLVNARMRPFLAPFYRPGIIFNAMKSGLAVDYPVYQGEFNTVNYTTTLAGLANAIAVEVGGTVADSEATAQPTAYYAIGPRAGKVFEKGSTWDYRIPFEAIVEPEKYITGMPLIDMEPHPSAALNVIAQWDGTGDNLHQLMANNFLAEVPEFFLPKGRFSSIESAPENDFKAVKSGSLYAMRVKLRRSTVGKRVWRSMTNDSPLMDYSIPQDPRIIAGQVKDYKETFTMYSRQSAFGPPVASDLWFGFINEEVLHPTGALINMNLYLSDSTMGINPAFTPGYFGGEAWADIIFSPQESGKPTIDDIMANSDIELWRIDPWASIGPDVGGALGLSAPVLYLSNRRQGIWNGNAWVTFPRTPLDAYNANNYSMQLDASFNLFGKNQDKWIIEPKFETPMYNFNDSSARPLASASNTLTIPTHGSESVPRGMWHQFGLTETEKGVYLEVGDIPQLWLNSLQYRTSDPAMTNEFSYYTPTDYVPPGGAASEAVNIKSLADIMGFQGSALRLGQTAPSKTISEAVVAIPFIEEDGERKFFAIPQYIIGQILGKYGVAVAAAKAGEVTRTAIEGVLPLIDEFLDDQSSRQAAIAAVIGHAAGETATQVTLGDTESFYPSKTIVDMVNKMKKYIFPPRLDFVTNFESVSPFAMYIFEFEYQLDKTDLSYIWQNLPPKIAEQSVQKTSTIRHSLLADQLMGNFGVGSYDIIPDGLQWMVFKVKTRANNNYFSKVTKESGEKTAQKAYSYNWPYDFFSLIEFINIDVNIGIGKNPDMEKQPDKSQIIASYKDDIAKIAVVSDKPMPEPPDQRSRIARSQTQAQRDQQAEEKLQEKRQQRKERGKARGKKKK